MEATPIKMRDEGPSRNKGISKYIILLAEFIQKNTINMYMVMNSMNRELETDYHTSISYHGVVALSAREYIMN